MGASIAQLNGRVFEEMDDLADYLTVVDIHRAVVQSLNIRTRFAAIGATDVMLAVSDPITVTDKQMVVTSDIGIGTPVGLEIYNPNNPNGLYYPVRIVSRQVLPQYEMASILAVAFWALDEGNPLNPLTQYMEFSILPNAQVRILFDRDTVRTDTGAASLLPGHVDDLIVKDACNILLPRVKLRIGRDYRRDEESREIAQGMLTAIDEVFALNARQIRQLEGLWKTWAFRDRAAEDGYDLPTPNSRSLYSDEIIY